jgi:predicted N-acetyltransferase YhbS
MTVTVRRFQFSDVKKVGNFLIENYRPGNRDGNWLRPAWDYMHSHPELDENALERIGIWEENGRIVAAAHYESALGEVFFQLHPDHHHLKSELLDHAESNLTNKNNQGDEYLQIYINDFDRELESLALSRGYQRLTEYTRQVSELIIPEQIPEISLPDGFALKTLADDNDLNKIHRVLWRGFNHPGEPPADGLQGRLKMQSSPNFRKDLTIFIEDPRGNLVAFAGLWLESRNRIAYVEPLAVDPDHRRRGFGRGVVWEGIRRCKLEGVTSVFVGSDLEFYQSMGFRRNYESRCWEKKVSLRCLGNNEIRGRHHWKSK